MTGTPEGSTESGFMEKPGIEPATPGLQGIALIHYTTGELRKAGSENAQFRNYVLDLSYVYIFFIILQRVIFPPFKYITNDLKILP